MGTQYVISHENSPARWLLDLLQTEVPNYNRDLNGNPMQVITLPTEYRAELIIDDLDEYYESLPAVIVYSIETEFDQRGFTAGLLAMEKTMRIVVLFTDDEEIWKWEQIINDIIVRNRRLSSTTQYADINLDIMLLDKAENNVLRTQSGQYIYKYHVDVDIKFQEAFN